MTRKFACLSRFLGHVCSGLLLLLGIEQGDGLDQVNHLASKVSKLRLWPDLKDSKKQWASSVVDNGFELMVVSQFTLFATFKKPKPDFHQAMGGSEAEGLCEAFVGKCRSELSPGKVSTGSFGAMMNVELCNDGPGTQPGAVQRVIRIAPSTLTQKHAVTKHLLGSLSEVYVRPHTRMCRRSVVFASNPSGKLQN